MLFHLRYQSRAPASIRDAAIHDGGTVTAGTHGIRTQPSTPGRIA
jgi:hypothetical protein